jgi:hypothetical protein
MFEYDKYAKAAAEELDKYDFTDLLSMCYDRGFRSPEEIIDEILEEYEDLAYNDDVWDNLSMDELMQYLCKKYNIRFEAITSYQMFYCCK